MHCYVYSMPMDLEVSYTQRFLQIVPYFLISSTKKVTGPGFFEYLPNWKEQPLVEFTSDIFLNQLIRKISHTHNVTSHFIVNLTIKHNKKIS